MKPSSFASWRLERKKHVRFDKWGYIFLIPFFAIFLVFSLVPLGKTFVYAFQTYYDDMLTTVGPTWCGLDNFKYIFTQGSQNARSLVFFDHTIATVYWSDFGYYLFNTVMIWIYGFIPQIILSLLLAIWFTNLRLKIKGQRFWKTVMYMPNLIMAAAIGMLFLMIFASNGPIMALFKSFGWVGAEGYDVTASEMWTRIIIAFLNCLMWFGNTTLLLMSGMMGIDQSIYESATVDGASSPRVFFQITMPLLRPIFIYVVITSMIGGIQLFDVAQIFTKMNGGPFESSKTIMMYLYRLIINKTNYGQAGALSVILFVVTAIFSMAVYWVNNASVNPEKAQAKAMKKRFRVYGNCEATKAEIASKGGM